MIVRPNRIGRRWLGLPAVTPRALFLNGTDGFAFDFSTPATLFQDAAGSTPLTAPGQTIGLVCDKSRPRSPVTSYAGIQASAGLRPTYGRAPKSRRNWLTWTEDFSDAAWPKTNVTLTNNATTAPDGTVTADGFAASTNALAYSYRSAALTTGQWTYSLYVKQLGANSSFDFYFNDLSGRAAVTLTFAAGVLSLTAVSMAGTVFSGASVVSDNLGGGWYRVALTASYASGTSPAISLMQLTGRDGTSGAYIWGAQLELGSTATPYQCVKAAFDMAEAGYPAYGFARPDLADDKFAVTLPAPITGDLMLFGRNGSWIEAGVTLPSGAFDLGPTGTVLTPGVLRALGDLVGAVIIGRTTTATERALALRYFAARGAAGWLVAGAEMLSNGGFIDGTGWTNSSTGTGTAAISGGQATLTGVDVSNRGILSLTTNVTGITIRQPYMIQWQITSGTANSQVTVSSGGTVLDRFGASVVETRRAVFIAGATAIGLSFNVYGAGAVVFDNFSIKPLTIGA